eukprot:1399256-Lingulodinium_polyedra.AAC.1
MFQSSTVRLKPPADHRSRADICPQALLQRPGEHARAGIIPTVVNADEGRRAAHAAATRRRGPGTSESGVEGTKP